MRRGAMGAGALWALSLGEFMSRGVEARRFRVRTDRSVRRRTKQQACLCCNSLKASATCRTAGQAIRFGAGCRVRTCTTEWPWSTHLGNSGKLILVRNHEGDVSPATRISNRRPITYLSDGGGGTTNLGSTRRRERWEEAWADPRRHRPQLRRRRDAVGHVAHRRGNRRRGSRLAVRGRQGGGDPTPLKAMGRFSHEACMIDPNTGYVYETEDDGDSSGFYKFVPLLPRQPEEGRRPLHAEGEEREPGRSPHGVRRRYDMGRRMGANR